MNSTLIFVLGMGITAVFFALMLCQSLSAGTVLGSRIAPATRFGRLSPMGSMVIAALGLAALIWTVA